MALSKNDLARELFGKSRIEEASTHARETHVITGTATEDSADGTVRVDFGGNAVTADGQQSVPVTTTGDIREGDTVLATVVGSNGTAKSPTVIGTPGGGDRTRSEIAAATKSATEAEAKAAEAVTKADEAERKADSLEDTINSKADATVTLADGSKAQLSTLVKQNAAQIATKADATVKLDDGTDAELGTLAKQTAAELTTKADATVTLDDGTKADLETTVKQDHKSLTTVIKTQDDISTIIREDSTGVTVGKSEDGGKTYSTARAHVSSSGSFETVLPDGTVVASMGKYGQQIGADYETHFNVRGQEASITTARGTKTLTIKDTADHTRTGGGTQIYNQWNGDGRSTSFTTTVEMSDNIDGFVLTVDDTIYPLDSSPTTPAAKTYKITNSSTIVITPAPPAKSVIRLRYYTKIDGIVSINAGHDNSTSTNGVNAGIAIGHNNTTAGFLASALGGECYASGQYSLATGYECKAVGSYSAAQGNGAGAYGKASHAEGISTTSYVYASHTEGISTEADGDASHAEGNQTLTRGESSHAEGNQTQANGESSHAEGNRTNADGESSHAEGSFCQATADHSHAEGYATVAKGWASHAEGFHTIASESCQSVLGQYNAEDRNALFIVGNGTSDTARHNALSVDENGMLHATTCYYVPVNGWGSVYIPYDSFEWVIVTLITDDNVLVSQPLYIGNSASNGTGYNIEFSSNHFNNGVMYTKNAVIQLYFRQDTIQPAASIYWSGGGVHGSDGAIKEGTYFMPYSITYVGAR